MLTCDSNTSIFSFSENAGRFVSHVAFGVNPKLRLNHLHYLFFSVGENCLVMCQMIFRKQIGVPSEHSEEEYNACVVHVLCAE